MLTTAEVSLLVFHLQLELLRSCHCLPRRQLGLDRAPALVILIFQDFPSAVLLRISQSELYKSLAPVC